ncbi:MAG: GTP-binding protein [Candidatus Heimdallarchaeota archaeon]|nr:GTP-binding protein [Candidatus Heimdallarchaeota archaeon]
MRQAQNSFPIAHQPTLGANFLIWNTIIDGEDIKLIIGDSGSQERFYSVLPTYFKGSIAAALIFDITKRESFEKLNFWLGKLEEGVGKVPVIIVGNKIDLDGKRQVSKEEGEEFADKLGTIYFEVSAKENANLFSMFKKMAEIALDKDIN